MAEMNLSKYGITGTTEIVHNPSYELLFEEETKPGLEGFEKGQVSELGAVNVMTGEYTGRSPKDKFIVVDENSKDTVWWTSDEYKNDNHPATQEAWETVKKIAWMSFLERSFTLWTHSAEQTRIPVWRSASLWKLHGRHISLPICLSSLRKRSLKSSSQISSYIMRPKAKVEKL